MACGYACWVPSLSPLSSLCPAFLPASASRHSRLHLSFLGGYDSRVLRHWVTDGESSEVRPNRTQWELTTLGTECQLGCRVLASHGCFYSPFTLLSAPPGVEREAKSREREPYEWEWPWGRDETRRLPTSVTLSLVVSLHSSPRSFREPKGNGGEPRWQGERERMKVEKERRWTKRL